MADDSAKPPPTHMLGDKIAIVTQAIGISPCARCKRRREALNQVRTDQGFVQAAVDVVKAALT